METWKHAWREGAAPLLSQRALEALQRALVQNDPQLIQGATTVPPPLQCVQEEDGMDVCLTQSMVTTVDRADYAKVCDYHWHAFDNQGKGWYARTKVDGKHIFMHQLLLGERGVDHKDGDGLNNRRSNLRTATATENARNRNKPAGATSGYKGVYLFKPNVWRSTITYDGKQHSLGVFATEKEAARAYDKAAKQHFGAFAVLNFSGPDAPVEAACALGYCGWRGEGLETVAEVEEFFARMSFEVDQRLGEPASCRWFLNFWDDTPRDEARRLLLPEVEVALAATQGA